MMAWFVVTVISHQPERQGGSETGTWSKGCFRGLATVHLLSVSILWYSCYAGVRLNFYITTPVVA